MNNIVKNDKQQKIRTVINNYVEYGMDDKEILSGYDKESMTIVDMLNKLCDLDDVSDYEDEYDNVFKTLNTIEKDKTYCYVVARMIINYMKRTHENRRPLKILVFCLI